jgi:two-component system response regulator LytT
MLKAPVVDDEAPARSELRFLLGEAGGVEVIGEASNAIEATQLIKAIPYDVIFLDINMPGLTGVQLAEALSAHPRPPAIIFVTAHSEHAVKAFEVKATDYLVKPVDLERLRQAISRLTPVAEQAPARVERIPVEKAGKKLLVAVDDILYIMAKDDYSYLHTTADRLSRRCRFRALKQARAAGFFRQHRAVSGESRARVEVVPMYGAARFCSRDRRSRDADPVSRRRVPRSRRPSACRRRRWTLMHVAESESSRHA